MLDYQRAFIHAALANNILSFGKFTLKSGRQSPYFFNLGQCSDSHILSILSKSYADVLAHQVTQNQNALNNAVLFGPAYKGIPLAVTTVLALYTKYQINLAYCFNRKETKDHGEGGELVGAALNNKSVFIIDDVITKGTAIREAIDTIHRHSGQLAGIVIALDRQEKGFDDRSAIQEIQEVFQIPVYSIITLEDILEFVSDSQDSSIHAVHAEIEAYRLQYGVNAPISTLV